MAYQQAQSILCAIDLLDEPDWDSIVVEGILDDVFDLEVRDVDGRLVLAKQFKSRESGKPWGRTAVLGIIKRWAASSSPNASFEFVTNGRLGPSAEALKVELQLASDPDLKLLEQAVPTDLAALPKASRDMLSRVTLSARDESSTAILSRAEARLADRNSQAFNEADAQDQARQAIDSLLREFVLRSGEKEFRRKFVRSELEGLLNQPSNRSGRSWAEVRSDYLHACKASSRVGIERTWTTSAGEKSLGPLAGKALDASHILVVAGQSGLGKSTECRRLREIGALNERAVVVLPLETYVGGGLRRSVAQALEATRAGIGSDRVVDGVIRDREAVLVLDGVSEISELDRQSLRSELRELLAQPVRPNVILVGRDPAECQRVLPRGQHAETLSLDPLSSEQQVALVAELLDSDAKRAEPIMQGLRARIGDAVENPQLLSMAAVSPLHGDLSRADLYATYLSGVLNKAKVAASDKVLDYLGVRFSALLDLGKRSADTLAWSADENLVPASEFLEAIAAGILEVVAPYSLVRATHDSFADFLSARAISRGIAQLPGKLSDNDRLRLEFIAMIGDLPGSLEFDLPEQAPLNAISVSRFDHAGFDASSPVAVTRIGRTLGALGASESVVLCHANGRSFLALANGEAPRVAQASEIAALMSTYGITEVAGGNLKAGVAIWRNYLVKNAANETGPELFVPRTADSALEALLAHDRSYALEVERALKVLPLTAQDLVRSIIGATHHEFLIRSDFDGQTHDEWSLQFRSAELSAGRVVEEFADDWGSYGSAMVENWLRKSPQSAAWQALQSAMNAYLGYRWL